MAAPRERLAGLLAGTLETTTAGVELALVRAFAGLRVVNLTQLWIAGAALVGDSPRPALDLALMVMFSGWSVVAVGVAFHKRRITDHRLIWADTTCAVAILTGGPLITEVGQRVDTWHNWPHPVSLSTALIIGAALPLAKAAAGTALLAGTYIATTMPNVIGFDERWTVLTNAVAYLAFALIGGALAGFLRRLGRDADTQRERAEQLGAQLGAEAELERHRLLLHDHAALLAFIGHQVSDIPEVDAAMRRQALDGAYRVSAFLASTPATRPLGQTLAETVAHAATAFPDLPVTVNVDLAAEQTLDLAIGDVVHGAVTTLLVNVRRHAVASSVTVHASGSDGAWEVSVVDDGVGFDPARTPPGYGLARQVRARCETHGVAVRVVGSPGEGTTVTLTSHHPSSQTVGAQG